VKIYEYHNYTLTQVDIIAVLCGISLRGEKSLRRLIQVKRKYIHTCTSMYFIHFHTHQIFIFGSFTSFEIVNVRRQKRESSALAYVFVLQFCTIMNGASWQVGVLKVKVETKLL
jgi:hypothetical protein